MLTNLKHNGSLIKTYLDARYTIQPLKVVLPFRVYQYVTSLAAKDLLKYRLNDIKNPTIEDMHRMIEDNSMLEHFVTDLETELIVSEFNVTPVSGKMGIIHFSAEPSVSFKRSIELGSWITNRVLTEWKSGESLDEPYLTSLVGLTPARNRQAVLYVRKCGFERVAEIHEGCYYHGEPDTAVMTIKRIKTQLTG